jgi:7-keto-8-aminopelargonate synthetase-like enzyme
MRVRQLGMETIDSPAPIVAFRWGNRTDMLALQRRLFDRGIHIHYSNYVGAGPEGIIRCAVFRNHSREDIDALVDAMRLA